jgi:S-adenosylmethionine decarboxylase
MTTMQFGYHLTLDLYQANPTLLDSLEVCYNALEQLPARIEMRPLAPPVLLRSAGTEARGGFDPGGITGFILIEQSHISLHTFVKRGFASIDVYSCKAFETSIAIAHFKNTFEATDEEIHFIQRGSRYPTANLY